MGINPVIKISSDIVEGKDSSIKGLSSTRDYWKISISDNGIGFEQQYTDRIFELFQRLHEKEKYVGTGIGLAICKKIMQNHNGFITAIGKNEFGGATFNILLPAVPTSIN